MAENGRRQAQWQLMLGDRELAYWRQTARVEMLRDAVRYTRSYRDIELSPAIERAAQGDATEAKIVMAGHQPTLFHPGVWFKNFAIDAIRRRIMAAGDSAVAVNLVIDNDVATSSSIRVPAWDPQRGQLSRQNVAYDSAAGGVPFEQNRIRDRALFEAFGDSVHQVISPLVPDPLVRQLWPHVVSAARRCENVSCALAQGRHALEGEQGVQTLELPLSVICRSRAFAAFVLTLIGDPARLRTTYNESVARYRRANGIRSSAHPVPSLGHEGDWIEVPLWIYSDGSPQRRGAWVRVRDRRLEISDRHGLSITLSHQADSEAAAAELADRCGPQFKLRPRALLTTMYARLLLSDLFVHGIGGAKYDELGDQIIHRFFQIEPPELMVVSATVMLPVAERGSPDLPTVAELRQQIRQTYFAPEMFADRVALPADLCAAKRQLIANEPGPHALEPGRKKAWHERLAAVNGELSRRLVAVRQSLWEQMPEARQAENAAAILDSREHPFCLFPLQELMSVFAKNL